jgi:hypothetical protein
MSVPDFRYRVTMPIRDFGKIGAPVAFCVDVYGVTSSDIATIGGDIGSRPLEKAVTRLGLDPHRFKATLWDVPS